jgi:hypothetical protein
LVGQALFEVISGASAGNLRVESSDQLDVLLRHRLLRHPGGFEGFGSVQERRPRNSLAAPKLRNMEDPLSDFAARRLHATSVSHGGKHAAPFATEQLIHLDPPLVERVPVRKPRGIELIEASVDAEARKPRRIECRVGA